MREDRHSDRTGGGRNHGGYEGRGDRGSRGGRGGRGNRGDRHSRGLPQYVYTLTRDDCSNRSPSEHAKQADQSWGAPTGQSEWADERAGDAIAKDETKEGLDTTVEAPVDADGNIPETVGEVAEGAAPAQPAAEPEPEDHSKSYGEYLAEQAEKKLRLGTGVPEARKPNEGSKQEKKWSEAKPLSKEDEEDSYIPGKGEKAKRERQRKEKTRLDVDMRYVEPSRGGDRGRGGRGRGEGRGDFRGGDRGRGGRGRGDGYRGRGDGDSRGGYRGGRGGNRGDGVNVADTSAFPSLGGS